MEVTKIQHILKHEGVDGWLLSDFRGRDPLAYKVLGLAIEPLASRRWFYYIPASGKPVKLVSAVESARLDELKGEKRIFATYAELKRALERLVGGRKVLAHYSPQGKVPYISFLDAGTYQLIRAVGARITSAQDALQKLFSLGAHAQRSQRQAAVLVDGVRREAFNMIFKHADKKGVHEIEVQSFILRKFEKLDLITNHAPIVGANEHPADPHFELTAKTPSE